MAADFCSKEGADVLRHRIQEYWKERGYEIDVRLINQGFVPAMRSARTDIRSDLVNGLPQRAAQSAPAPTPMPARQAASDGIRPLERLAISA